jgi:DNA processing protein
MASDDPFYWFALRSVPLVGNLTFRRLLTAFGSPEKVLQAPADEIAAVAGVRTSVAAAIKSHDFRKAAETETTALLKSGAKVVTLHDDAYPPLLKEIPDPPPYLYLHGSLPAPRTAIAVVGSRRASEYGIATTTRLARELAEQGVAIISGLAQGVDAAAHRAALQVSGSTVGVLGCGIDMIYPDENRKLFREMAEKGGIISEFPVGTPPDAVNASHAATG